MYYINTVLCTVFVITRNEIITIYCMHNYNLLYEFNRFTETLII